MVSSVHLRKKINVYQNRLWSLATKITHGIKNSDHKNIFKFNEHITQFIFQDDFNRNFLLTKTHYIIIYLTDPLLCFPLPYFPCPPLLTNMKWRILKTSWWTKCNLHLPNWGQKMSEVTRNMECAGVLLKCKYQNSMQSTVDAIVVLG